MDRKKRKGKNERIIQADLRLRRKKGQPRSSAQGDTCKACAQWSGWSGVLVSCVCVPLCPTDLNGTSVQLGKPIMFI